MKHTRKEARERLKSMNTVSELNELLDDLMLTEEDKEIARYVFVNGYSQQQIAMKCGYSVKTVKKKLAKVYDRLL